MQKQKQRQDKCKCREFFASLRMTNIFALNDGAFMGSEVSLEEGQEGEEEEPEDTHGVPVPGDAIDQNLTGFELAGDVETNEGGDERCDAEEQMDGVDAGDQVEEVAALVGAEENPLDSQLPPCGPLTGEKEQAEDSGG